MFFKAPLSDVKKSIKGIGHPKYPFFDSEYSPGSSIPCTDFSPWVLNWLKERDYKRITLLMQEFMSDLSAQALVKTIQGFDLQKQILGTQEFIDDFKTMLILIGNRVGGSDMLKAMFYSDALFIHKFTFRPEFHEKLLNSLHAFWRKEPVDMNYEYYPKLNATIFDAPKYYPEDNPLIDWFLSLPLATRLHFMCSIHWTKKRKTPLIKLSKFTDYSLREFGVNIDISSQLLAQSPVFTTATSFADFGRDVSKDQLCEFLSNASVDYKKTMSKDNLVELEHFLFNLSHNWHDESDFCILPG